MDCPSCLTSFSSDINLHSNKYIRSSVLPNTLVPYWNRKLRSFVIPMDDEDELDGSYYFPCSSSFFRCFVFLMLSFLFGLQVHTYLYGPKKGLDGSFNDIKYVVMQLTRGLSEVQKAVSKGQGIERFINVKRTLQRFVAEMAMMVQKKQRMIAQVNRKHERLQTEMERVSSALPAVAAAAGRARDALGPALHVGRGFDLNDYDRQLGDYALESAGARVLDTGDTVGHFMYESPVSWVLHQLTAWVCRECQSARAIIQPGTLPGQCWAFKGATGEATIRLLGTIYVTGFSVEHIPAHIDPTREILAAPRLVQLEGLRSRADQTPHSFGTFEYKKDESPIQYFEVTQPSPRGFNIVRFKVLSNWGHPVYTCVYRVRVHGELLPGQAPKITIAAEEDVNIENE